MTTRQVIPQMKYYADAADYNNPGSFTSMIQMKSRLETLEEATKRTIYEEELEKKRNSINKNIIYYVDKNDYKNPGTFTSMIQLKSRLETLEEKQEREKLEGEEKDKIEKLKKEKLEKECIEQCQNMENGYAEKV
jgi:tRNA(Ile)-lysidine synthase TilS/MesJ